MLVAPRFAPLFVALLALALGLLPVSRTPAQTLPAAESPAPPSFSVAELDQMLAPIALYPDGLLGQILIAATYPLEVVQADRWLQEPAQAGLNGNELVPALETQPWDASVKALTAFPQVLSAMDNNLSWTEQLGNAFLAQQADVIDRVQALRARAQAARTLVSSQQQTVTNGPDAIEIAPASPDTVYVPAYDPGVVYGTWPYADYPPNDFELPGYVPGGFIAFVIVVPLWGWDSWDWRHHRLGVGEPGTLPRRPGPNSHPWVPWKHNPAHRHGVPYRSQALEMRFAGPAGQRATQGEFHGYPPPLRVPGPAMPSEPVLREPTVRPGGAVPRPEPARPAVQPAAPAQQAPGRNRATPVRPAEARGSAGREAAAPANGGGEEHR